jgi:hypothetical protein
MQQQLEVKRFRLMNCYPESDDGVSTGQEVVNGDEAKPSQEVVDGEEQ